MKNANLPRRETALTLSISAAARLVGVRREIIRQAVSSGELPARRLPGRCRYVLLRSDVEGWLQNLPEGR